MDIVLAGIAAISLVLAVAMGAVLFKVLRDERQRSDARVALLASAAAPASFPPDDGSALSAASAAFPGSDRAELFAAPETPSPWRRRLAVAGTLAVVAMLGGYALMAGGPAAGSHPDRPVAAQIQPLELLSLRHVQEAGRLTISGIVRNPRTGPPVSQAIATALLFGSDGSVLTSGRASLDFTALEPGDESPFVIQIPAAGTVSRYRVGFRDPDGAVIAHVDHRPDRGAARNDGHTGSVP